MTNASGKTSRRRAPISRREATSPGARANVAVATMIERGQARTLAASMTDHIASSAGLADVVGRVLQVYVAEKAKRPERMTKEAAQHLVEIYNGLNDGMIRAHEVVANSPLLTHAHDAATGRPMKAEILAPAEPGTPIVRETRLTAASRAFEQAAKP